MSDNSESWSSSESLYSSAKLGSYPPLVSRPVNRLQRFMQNLRHQLKRMTSSAPATRGYRLVSSDSDFDVPLRPLSYVLGANIQQSVGETSSDETVQVMNMVIQIPPGNNNETVMYEINDTISSSNNVQGPSNIKFEKNSLAAILLSKEPAFINLNFPNMDELIESLSESDDTYDSDYSDDENTLDEEADGQAAQDFAGNSCSVTYVKAELRVFRSGRATLSFGSKVFILAKAAKPKVLHKVVYLDMEDRMRSLGVIEHYIDVLPQEEKRKVETGETGEKDLQ